MNLKKTVFQLLGYFFGNPRELKRSESEDSAMSTESFFDSIPSGKMFSFYAINLRYLFTSADQSNLERDIRILLDHKSYFYNLPADFDLKTLKETLAKRYEERFKASNEEQNWRERYDSLFQEVYESEQKYDKIESFQRLFGWVCHMWKSIQSTRHSESQENNGVITSEKQQLLRSIDIALMNRFAGLNRRKQDANMWLASREFTDFAKLLDALKLSKSQESEIEKSFAKSLLGEEKENERFARLIALTKSAKLLPLFECSEEKGNTARPKWFVVKDETELLEEELKKGKQLSIFRQNLIEAWLSGRYYKIYQISSDELLKSDDASLDEVHPWKHKDSPVYYLKLSKLGVLQIRKEEVLPGSHVSKQASLIESLVRLVKDEESKKFNTGEEARIVFEFCKLIQDRVTEAYKFFHGLDLNSEPRFTAKEQRDFYPKYEQSRELTRLERQRHLVIVINRLRDNQSRIVCPNREMNSISKNALAILEGRFLRDSGDKAEAGLPRYKYREVLDKINSPKDLSTWNDELCFFTGERSLIYLREENRNNKYPFENHKEMNASESKVEAITYEDYWNCIIRGIEFSSLIRMALRINASKTTRLIKNIPDQLLNFESKNFNRNRDEIRNLENELAHLLKVVPEVRNACSAINMFRSERNVKKFDYLQNDCFQFKQILENINTNIDDLSDFITLFKQRVLQTASERQNRSLSIIALLFTATTILSVLPSFVKDFSTWDSFADLAMPLRENLSLSLNKEGWFASVFLFSLALTIFIGGLWHYSKIGIEGVAERENPKKPKWLICLFVVLSIWGLYMFWNLYSIF